MIEDDGGDDGGDDVGDDVGDDGDQSDCAVGEDMRWQLTRFDTSPHTSVHTLPDTPGRTPDLMIYFSIKSNLEMFFVILYATMIC